MSELNSLKLTKFGTIKEDKDGYIVLDGFEFEGDEERTVAREGDVDENEIISLIVDRIKSKLEQGVNK